MGHRKTITITSVFPAAINQIWPLLTKVETLQFIAAPYASFVPLEKGGELAWREGETARYNLRIFGFFPMGTHTIAVKTFDEETHKVFTEEHNRMVPVWNHAISLVALSEESAEYTDNVDIDAGWITPFVVLWSKLFYRHRQKKWLRLLKK